MSRYVDWRDQAVCLDADPDLFFPTGTTGPALWQVYEAKQVCARCPVISQCLDWAVRTNTTDGVFGGQDGDERRATRRRHQRSLRPTG